MCCYLECFTSSIVIIMMYMLLWPDFSGKIVECLQQQKEQITCLVIHKSTPHACHTPCVCVPTPVRAHSMTDGWHTWWMNLYWSFVWTIPGLSWRSVETILSTSIFESPCRIPWMPMSMASRVPVRPTPAEQWTTAGPLPSAILTALKLIYQTLIIAIHNYYDHSQKYYIE